VLELYGITKINNEYCMVTEFLAGGTLRDLINNHRNVVATLRLKICRGISRGMEYLHNFEPPIIHRDLTSSNVLLDKDANPKISDFGCSRFQEDTNSMNMSTAIGSLAWMAPEVYRGDAYNAKADVYSFAIICWELWSLADPYCNMAPDMFAALAALENRRPPIEPFNIPQNWNLLIAACWAPEPHRRPSFSQIIQYLENQIT